MHARAGGLGLDNFGLRFQHLVPSRGHLIGRQNLLGELNERKIMAMPLIGALTGIGAHRGCLGRPLFEAESSPVCHPNMRRA